DVQAVRLEHLTVLLGRRSEGGEEVAHHHAVQPRLDGERLQLAEVLDAPAAETEERFGKDQAEDRDPLHGLPRVDQLAVAELRPGTWIEQVDGNARGVDRGELESHLDALRTRLPEVEDATHARLEARLPNGGDGAQSTLVAHRSGDLVVVARRGLDVVVHA